MSQYCEKAKSLLCHAIEAQEHILHVLEALQVALLFEQTDDIIQSLLTGLSETAYLTSEALTRSLANVRMLQRESMLRATKQDSAIAKEIRKTFLLGPKEAQFSDTMLKNVAALEQVVVSRSMAVALRHRSHLLQTLRLFLPGLGKL